MSEVSEAGIITEPEFLPTPEVTDDDILRMGDSKTLKQLKEQGAFLSKQLDKQIKGSGDKAKDLFILAIFYLNSGKTEEDTFEKLAGRNAKLAECDQFTFEELQDIRDHAARYIAIMQQVKRDAVQQEAKEEIINQEPDEIDIAAEGLLESGNLYKEYMRLFSTLHVADERTAEVLLVGYLAQSLHAPDVIIQPVLDGEKGSGKSSGVLAALHLMPEEYVCKAAFSPKSLFRYGLPDKSIIYIDDDTWDPELGAAIKRYMNDVTEGTKYITLDQNREPVALDFPFKCMFITSCVGDSGDDQLLDRQFRITVSKDQHKQRKHQDMVKRELATGQPRRLVENDDIKTVRRALSKYREYDFQVFFPEAGKMRFVDGASMRDIEVFKIFLRASAILHYRQRRHEIKDNIVTVWSEGEQYKEDLRFANQVFKMNAEQRELKTNGAEGAVYDAIKKLTEAGEEVTLNDIVQNIGKSLTTVRDAIYGRDGVGGLVSKVPGLTVQKVSVKIENRSTNKTFIKLPTGSSWANLTNTEFAYYE